MVTRPIGKAENAATGKYRSTFDLHLTQPGTYRVAVVNNGLFASYNWLLIVFIAVVVGFFALTVLFVKICESILEQERE